MGKIILHERGSDFENLTNTLQVVTRARVKV